MTQLRVLHNIAAANGLPVNVFVDNQLVLSNVVYTRGISSETSQDSS
jgi:hypothetical protein